MKRMMILICFLFLLAISTSRGEEIYQWTDEKGTIHFTDDLNLIPERFRNQVQRKQTFHESPPSPSPFPSPRPQGMERKPPSQPPPEQRDLQGRDEQWWREKVKEWEDKLQIAQKNYEKAYQELKAKEKQLDDSTFKPNSVRRRIKTEIRDLEEKAKAAEKEVEAAKRMLEKVLPWQAEEDRADPKWLKPKEQVESTPGKEPSPQPIPAGAAPPPEPVSNK